MANLEIHGQFENSLKRGTQNQANENPNKAQYLATFLAIYNVGSMDDLTPDELILLNVNIRNIDSNDLPTDWNSECIGAMIQDERNRGINHGHD